MNQRSREKTKNSVEKGFQLLNNTKLGDDCKNNIENCKSELIHDDIDYISYIRKSRSLFDKSVSEFLNSRVIAEEIDVKRHDEN